MGEVYRAFDTHRERMVAVKLLRPEVAADPNFQERFRRESRVAARLQEPHVIPVHDFGAIDGVLYIDMRLVDGASLKEVLRAEGPLEPGRAGWCTATSNPRTSCSPPTTSLTSSTSASPTPTRTRA
jgi:serine/threonine-protein kinase